ncbi:MAG: amino acid ABC transporter ATP-binding protein [Clostridia bacterium]|nr:amino acid ABC transporter ATP-binding protein [Clostridia bacterium]
MAVLEVVNLKKRFGNLEVLKGIDFSMEKGEVLAVIGSSGGGKTTLLRSLTFLERIEQGKIIVDGEEIVSEAEFPVKAKKLKKGETAPEARTEVRSVYPKDEELRIKGLKMGLVFQDFNLFPQYSVLGNLTLAPMLVQKKTKEEATVIAEEMLEKVGLIDKRDAYPYQLSGGQKQRVAIARALCMNPSILCFDEPTSALDPELTLEVLKVIASLKKQGVTMLIVTHEIEFARDVADTVIFLDKGLIIEKGNAKDVIDNPQTDRAKEFLHKISSIED